MKKKILYREGEINERHRCGCYLRRYPHVVQDKTQMSMLPLRSIDYHMEIVNSIVNITMTQKYFNPGDKYLEIDYLVPINVGSSIYKFEVQFGTVKIEGIVKQKKQAKLQFQQAKREGRQAALGTVDSDKDVFKLELGNIPPLTELTVTIMLLQQLKVSQNTFYHLEIPAIISPRSMAKDPYNWTFKLDLKSSRKVTFFSSPSHKMTMINQNEQCTETLLVMQKQQIPNKDFSFVYTTENFHLPSCVIGNTDFSSTVMLSFIPKFCTLQATDAYNALLQSKSYEVDISTVKGEYIFFLDRSHSMGGKRLAKAKQSLIIFLKSIPENSYFNIISFGGHFELMFQQSRKYSTETANQAIKRVQQMKANMGGTQILLPLQQCLRKSVIHEYPRHIYLLTDGGVQDTEQVLKTVKNNTNYCRVHSIGIGDGASKELIQGCANNGKGKFVMVSDEQNPTQKIIQLLQSSLSSLISKVNLKHDDPQIQAIVPNPTQIPYILKDNPANFFITYKGPLTQKKQFTFEYQDPINKQLYSTEIQINPQIDTNFVFVQKLGAIKVLQKLENIVHNRGNNTNQIMYYCERQSAKKKVNIAKYYQQQAIKYSIKHQILSQFTAFICVGKQLIDGQYQQWKNTGSKQVIVPTIINQNLKRSRNKLVIPKCATKSKVMMKKSKSSVMQIARGRNLFRGRGGAVNLGAIPHYNQFGDFDDTNNKIDDMAIEENYQMQSQEDNDQNIEQDDYQEYYDRQEPCKKFKRSRQLQKSRSKSRQKQRQKSNRKQKQVVHEYTNLLDSIIRTQQANGSWNSSHILTQLAKNFSVVQALTNSMSKQIVITKVVLLWLTKHHNTKQLNLIIKKAISWLNSALKKNNIDEKVFSNIQII